MLCPLGEHVAGTQLSEQKKTRPVSSTSNNELFFVLKANAYKDLALRERAGI